MKDIENYGVQALDTKELINTEGGSLLGFLIAALVSYIIVKTVLKNN